MTYRGKVKNGVVVLDKGQELPEGMRVTVRPAPAAGKPAKRPKANRPDRKGIRKFAGIIDDLPPDASEKVEDYLYGQGSP